MPWDRLNLDKAPVFLGGIGKEFVHSLPPALTATDVVTKAHLGFEGVIQRMILNGRIYDDLLEVGAMRFAVHCVSDSEQFTMVQISVGANVNAWMKVASLKQCGRG